MRTSRTGPSACNMSEYESRRLPIPLNQHASTAGRHLTRSACGRYLASLNLHSPGWPLQDLHVQGSRDLRVIFKKGGLLPSPLGLSSWAAGSHKGHKGMLPGGMHDSGIDSTRPPFPHCRELLVSAVGIDHLPFYVSFSGLQTQQEDISSIHRAN